MPLWIPITIAAAFFQNLRSALQKHLKGQLSDVGATTTRFFYAWPLAILYLIGILEYTEASLPGLNTEFWIFLILGSLSQIFFTFLLIWLFSFRNFAVGNTFSKTETAQIALLGFILLGDRLSLTTIVAIILSVFGFVWYLKNNAAPSEHAMQASDDQLMRDVPTNDAIGLELRPSSTRTLLMDVSSI